MHNRRRILLFVVFGLLVIIISSSLAWMRALPQDRNETIVLLHGMGRSRASLVVLSHGLRTSGYRVLNFPYDERERTIAEIAGDLQQYIAKEVNTEHYHLVGHSLGNIVVRAGFSGRYPKGLSRIVMLAPPNHPSLLANKFADNPIYRWRTGDAGQRLSDETFYRSLPVPSVPFGVIAGTKGQLVTFNEANDGIVRVSSTKLEGMTDWVSVPHIHTFIMDGEDTLELIVRFLDTGKF